MSGHINYPLEVEDGSVDHSLRCPVDGQAGTVEPTSGATFSAFKTAISLATTGKIIVRCDSNVLYAIPLFKNS